MNPKELAFYQTLITAISGILGVLVGALITIIFNWKIKTKEVKLRIIEKVFDKRLIAHEETLKIAKLLRVTNLTYKTDNDKNALTYPAILNNRDSLQEAISYIHNIVNENSHWLSIDVFRELNYLQDYLVNLDSITKNIPEKDYPIIGVEIKSDLIDLSGSLEKLILKFFKSDIYKINLTFSEGHHKYQKEETINRLNSSKLSKYYNKTA